MPADLPRLRSLLAAATPGPWCFEQCGDKVDCCCIGTCDPPVAGEIVERYDETTGDFAEKPIVIDCVAVCEADLPSANAHFIVALVNAAPHILAVAEAAVAWHLADHSPLRRPSKARLLDALADAVEEMLGATGKGVVAG